MSGLEVAGLVLGALPIAIKAARAYRETLSSYRDARAAMDYLALELETERVIFRNTCELLLDGIAQPAEIVSMIENPLGPEWKSYGNQLGLKLWESVHIFDEHVRYMLEATQTLRLRLGIEEGSQFRSSDKKSILEAFKAKASFTLRKSEYEKILSRIKVSNFALQRICTVDRNLQSSRSSRSRSRGTNLLSRLSGSIYNAMCNAISCACASSHSVGFRLTHRDLIMLSSETEEEVGRKLAFQVALSMADVAKRGSAMHWLPYPNETQSGIHWNDFQLRLMNLVKPLPDLRAPQTLPQSKVRWAAELATTKSSASSSATQSISPLVTKNETVPPLRVSDLCDAVQRKSNTKAVSYDGYVLDSQRKFELSLQDSFGWHNSVSLRRVIDGSSSGLPPFGIEDKVEAMLALSSSIPHLYGTPWLPRTLTLDDVVFLFKEWDTTARPPHSSFHPFITKCVTGTILSQTDTDPTIQPTPTSASAQAVDLTVFSLGLLLIQVIIGHVDNRLGMINDMDVGSIISKREICGRPEVTEKILLNGGLSYSDVVRWCLDNVGPANLGNEEFRRRFHEAVIAPLDRMLRDFRSI